MICAVILAAGRSRRMGTQKLLLPVEGQPLICRVVDQVLASSVDQVVVVVGTDSCEVATPLAARPIRLATNPDPASEMIESVRCGLNALTDHCDAVLVVLGDQPGLTADLIDRLIGVFRDRHCGIVLPACRGERGHPLLLAMQYRDEILAQYDGTGLRGLIAAHPDEVVEVEVATPGVLQDVDEPADYRQLLGEALANGDGGH